MSVASQRQEKTASETRNVAVSFSNVLDSGELLTGTPTVTVTNNDSPESLVVSNVAVSTASLTINNETVPIGEAVQFKVTGGTADTEYTIKITAATDATPAQSLIGIVKLGVVADS